MQMKHSEAIVKRVLEAILPCTMTFHLEQSHMESDFELRYHTEATATVEVTESVDQTHQETVAAIHSKKKLPFIEARKCKKSWVIHPAKDANISKIRAAADEYLSRLEEAEIEHFFWTHDYAIQCVQDMCSELRIMNGSVVSIVSSPKIHILFPASGGAVGAILAIKAGEREAWKADNRKKLGAAQTAERHLVVYIDPTNGLPWIALTEFEPEATLPNLPEEVTDLWLVGRSERDNEFIVWHANAKEHWHSLRAALGQDQITGETRPAMHPQ